MFMNHSPNNERDIHKFNTFNYNMTMNTWKILFCTFQDNYNTAK